jgi:type II secretory pathway component PulF
MLALGILFPAYIVPQMKEMFNSFGIELPWATQSLIMMADFIISWPWAFALLLILPVSVMVAHNYLPGIGFRQWLYSWLPFLGESARLLGLSELCLQLSLLVRGHIPLPEAFQVLGQSLRVHSLRRACRQLSGQLAAGESPAKLLYQPSGFSPEILQLLSAAHEPEILADQLQLAGRAYATQAQVKTKQAMIIFEPLFLIFFASGFLFIIYALFGPLFRLLSDLS